MVGASGAISGVLGAYMLLYPRARVTVIVPLVIIFYPVPHRRRLGGGHLVRHAAVERRAHRAGQPGVAWWAHVGGFAAGMALTPFLKSRRFPISGRVLCAALGAALISPANTGLSLFRS